MKTDIGELYKRVEEFCRDPEPIFMDDTEALLRDLFRACFYEEDFADRSRLQQLIDTVQNFSAADDMMLSHTAYSAALDAYRSGDKDFSEFMFRSACGGSNDSSSRNNLTFLLRRKRKDLINNLEVMDLLLPGVKEREPFSMVNMGLLFALNLSSDDDWKTADDIFSLLPDNLSGADLWWEDAGKTGDIEGFLVHFFLLRWNRTEKSGLGSLEDIAAKLSRELEGFPERFAEGGTSEVRDGKAGSSAEGPEEIFDSESGDL